VAVEPIDPSPSGLVFWSTFPLPPRGDASGGLGWNDWPYWSRPTLGPYNPVRFTRVYSGKVVANLRDVGGRSMRCRFHLDDPARGMSGGGLGECQLAGGRSIDAIINRS
jgi:hypothetical protein